MPLGPVGTGSFPSQELRTRLSLLPRRRCCLALRQTARVERASSSWEFHPLQLSDFPGSQGWDVRGPVQRIWGGERDLSTVLEGKDSVRRWANVGMGCVALRRIHPFPSAVAICLCPEGSLLIRCHHISACSILHPCREPLLHPCLCIPCLEIGLWADDQLLVRQGSLA